MLAGAYTTADVGAGTFALDLIHPLADGGGAGGRAPVRGPSGLAGLIPAGRCCSRRPVTSWPWAPARTTCTPAGRRSWPGCWACACWARSRRRWPGWPGRPGPPGRAARVPAAGVRGHRRRPWPGGHADPVAGGSPIQPVIIVAVTAIVLALVAAWSGCSGTRPRPRRCQEASRQFSELANRTSDAVLVCDRDGTIESRAGRGELRLLARPAHGDVAGRAGHPEDRASGTRVALGAGDGSSGLAGRLPGARGRQPLAARGVDDLPVLASPGRRTGCW